jgi:hypothetical protein
MPGNGAGELVVASLGDGEGRRSVLTGPSLEVDVELDRQVVGFIPARLISPCIRPRSTPCSNTKRCISPTEAPSVGMVCISAMAAGSSAAMWSGMPDNVADVVGVSTAAKAVAPASAVARAAPLMMLTVRFLIDIEVP